MLIETNGTSVALTREREDRAGSRGRRWAFLMCPHTRGVTMAMGSTSNGLRYCCRLPGHA
jgi:hypothetical protein